MIEVVVVSPSATTTAWVWDLGRDAGHAVDGARAPRRRRCVSVGARARRVGAGAPVIVSRFVPRLASRSVMFAVVPCPTPTRATTDATPMITPSIVSAARSRPVRRREKREPDELEDLHADEPPIADVHLAAGRRGDVGVVGDEHDGAAGSG